MAQLHVIQPGSATRVPRYLATRGEIQLGSGFHGPEHDGIEAFRWMGPEGELVCEPAADERYLELWMCSEFHDLGQELTIEAGGIRTVAPLVGGWSPLSIGVPAGTSRILLAVNRIFPQAYYPTDTRTLAIRLRAPLLHADAERHRHIQRQAANARLNQQELGAGRAILQSTPPSLGIDLHGVCNVKPPCVYCEWDLNKALEGEHAETPFTRDTLREWGPFFDNATSLVNCSIGEPFMMRNFDELLEVFGDTGKVLEMTTNGQILTERNIDRLLGRRIDLYVSLDAATPETYAKLRNDTFDKILRNLRRLVDAKGGPGGLPRLHLVFMPMRVNVHELDAFVRLSADLRVDRMVLRPLNYSPGVELDWVRNGHHFQYQEELLPFDELVRVSGRAAELCRRLRVPLADQMDFGGSMEALFEDAYRAGRQDAGPLPGGPVEAVSPEPTPALPVSSEGDPEPGPLPSLGTEHRPACLEPWKSLYILRRGVFPCCYGGRPVAGVDGYREAWNSPLLQDIRSDLLRGVFHDYCLESPACPIVRKAAQSGHVAPDQAVLLRLRAVWRRLDAATGGRMKRLSRPARWLGTRAVRLLARGRELPAAWSQFQDKNARS